MNFDLYNDSVSSFSNLYFIIIIIIVRFLYSFFLFLFFNGLVVHRLNLFQHILITGFIHVSVIFLVLQFNKLAVHNQLKFSLKTLGVFIAEHINTNENVTKLSRNHFKSSVTPIIAFRKVVFNIYIKRIR